MYVAAAAQEPSGSRVLIVVGPAAAEPDDFPVEPGAEDVAAWWVLDEPEV